MRRRPRAPLLVVGNEPLFHAGADGKGRRDRLVSITEAVRGAGLRGVAWRVARPAPMAALERVHDRSYLQRLVHLRGLAPSAYAVRSVLPGSMAAVLLAAGACLEGVDALLDREARRVFCVAEPPGHHAERDRGLGFCAVNNVAIAALHAVARGCRRVLVVDWDVHHGNGTQQALRGRTDAVFFDCHQEGIFPGEEAAPDARSDDPAPNVFDVPLPAEMSDPDYAAVFEELLVPLAERFRPDLVLVSAGFDAHGDDPLGGMRLTADGFGYLCGVVDRIATRHAGGRLLLALEGGYNARAVGASAGRCAATLVTRRSPALRGEASAASRAAVDRLRARVEAFPRTRAAPRRRAATPGGREAPGEPATDRA